MNFFLYWLSRIVSIFSIGFILFFLVAHIIEDDFGEFLSLQEGVMFLFFPIGVCLGQIIAWERELIGGVITVISIGAFNLLDGSPYDFSMIDALALPGVLFIFSALYNKYK
jgi:hypothetical protein